MDKLSRGGLLLLLALIALLIGIGVQRLSLGATVVHDVALLGINFANVLLVRTACAAWCLEDCTLRDEPIVEPMHLHLYTGCIWGLGGLPPAVVS